MNILAFFAHPDDETVFAGGALALLARQGAQVHYLCATRGEGGETGEPPLVHTGRARRSARAGIALRRASPGRAQPDLPGLHRPARWSAGRAVSLHSGPDLPGRSGSRHHPPVPDRCGDHHGSRGEYGHPAHLLTHHASRIAVESFYGRRMRAAHPPCSTRSQPASPSIPGRAW